jgi:hypothetical protein
MAKKTSVTEYTRFPSRALKAELERAGINPEKFAIRVRSHKRRAGNRFTKKSEPKPFAGIRRK